MAISVDAYAQGVLDRDRTLIARAITLIESTRPSHRPLAQDLLSRLLPHAGGSHRIGITGVPGVGKSTFIDALGIQLTGAGHRVAVLTVDPTSSVTGGSILGDKTRMDRLATDDRAYIRPSPTSGTLGGVTRTTRETIMICEAAGYDIVLVETVGVGQSETVVADMVDTFVVLMLAGAGDALQGIKKGLLEIADVIAVNKADGDNETRARVAAREYSSALHLTAGGTPTWTTPVVTCSGLHGIGLDEVWSQVELHRKLLTETGEFEARRKAQQLHWMWSLIEDRLLEKLRTDDSVAALVGSLTAGVTAGTTPVSAAVDQVLAAFAEVSKRT